MNTTVKPLAAVTPSVRRSRSACLAILMAAGLFVGSTPGLAADSPAVTTASLLSEMTDLRGLASFPSPAFTCKQFSSYDRKSTSPKVPTTENWFANGDHGQHLRVEETAGRKEYVMMDATGPGAVVRIWSANPAGNIRIYLDGSAQPVIETPMTNLLGGSFPGLPAPIAGEYSRGWNLYFPIPYAKSCKITSDQREFYYHVNYRTYAAGTVVETFSQDQIKSLASQIERVVSRLKTPLTASSQSGANIEAFQETILAGKNLRSQTINGPMAVSRIILNLKAGNMEAALRGLLVKMTFDDETTVEGPLGDLFGSAPGLNNFATVPLGMNKDGTMTWNWFMPFKEAAVFEVLNTTSEDVSISGELFLTPYEWTDASMHLHAKWRVQWDVPTRPMIDWNYLTAKGQGVFAGVSFSIDNPVKDWWGEGDEKIYVDGETFPSHFGTGTEDYYGYAWCWPALFTHAYHSQSRCDGPGNFGRTSVNRFLILDRIPFAKDFRFDMELWHWNDHSKVNMAVTAYWYARPGGTDTFSSPRPEDAVVRPLAPYTPPRVNGAIEGESLKVIRATGTVEPQDWNGTSNEKHLWWRGGMKPGDTLTIAIPAHKPGSYRLCARFLSAVDYGIHQLSLNRRNLGEPIDFYAPNVRLTKEMDFGLVELKEGENQIIVTVVGSNPKAVKSYMFGLDYILLKPAGN